MRIKVVLLFLFIPMANFAQQIMVDRGVRVGGLWCFPLISDSLSYLYLPTNAHLSLDESKNPQFSFLRYVINMPKSGSNAVSDADGGGIVNFLVQYDTPENLVKTAQGILRERLKSEDITIKGPLVFDKGRYTLISSIIKSDTSKPTRKVLTTGEAPVLEGSRIALTFDLKPEASKLLLESFKMATPDVSLVFELGFSGLTDSYDAEMTVDWSEVKKSEAFKASGSVYIVSADVELGFDKLKRDGAIKLKSNGSDQQMEALVQTVYDKLLTLMFKPVKPETVPQDQQGGLMDALLGPNGILGSKNTLGFGLNVGFQMKDLQSEGKTNLYFKGRSTVNRTHFVTFNIGNLYNEYGKDEKYFKDIPMYDPTFQQREVLVGVDGDLEKEFTKMVNSVTVILDKKHQDGRETLHSVIITKKSQDSLKVSKKPLAMVYGFQKDTNRVEWLKYKYKTIWQFQGGGNLEMDWKTESSAMINLYTPFIRKTIMLEGDAKAINAKNIRAISVQIEYPFFGQKKQQRVTLKTSESLTDKKFEITLPNNVEEVDYSITWFGNDGSQKKVKGKDKYGLIFLDEMPN